MERRVAELEAQKQGLRRQLDERDAAIGALRGKMGAAQGVVEQQASSGADKGGRQALLPLEWVCEGLGQVQGRM